MPLWLMEKSAINRSGIIFFLKDFFGLCYNNINNDDDNDGYKHFWFH